MRIDRLEVLRGPDDEPRGVFVPLQALRDAADFSHLSDDEITSRVEEVIARGLALLDDSELSDEELAILAMREHEADLARRRRIGDELGYKVATLVPDDVVKAIHTNLEHPVKAWRKHRRLTQAALAKAADVSRITINKLEARRHAPKADVLARIAKVLGVLVEDLIDRRKPERSVRAAPKRAKKTRAKTPDGL